MSKRSEERAHDNNVSDTVIDISGAYDAAVIMQTFLTKLKALNQMRTVQVNREFE